ncbi:MAG: SIMPL domain-containing protein [Armatimonadetes bacterium]|nr:SIMPL domain-containing protein [Armatimonadota bacterium]
MRALSFVCLASLLVLTGCQPAPTVVVESASQQHRGLTVSGKASVRVQPSLVVIRLGVTHSDARPVAAKQKTERAIAQVAQAVEKAGIKAEDVQTSNFRLWQFSPYNKRPGGWSCSSILEIRVKKVESAGEVLERCMSAGANEVESVEFTVEDLETVRAQARDAASAVARAKAEQYAKNFGFTLGKPASIVETLPQNWDYMSNVALRRTNVGSDSSSDGSAERILSSGSVEVTLTVEVNYPLQ